MNMLFEDGPEPPSEHHGRKVADVWKKDVWEFQAKSGSSGSCRLFLRFLGKIAVRKMSGRTPGTPRRPSCRHPRPSDMVHSRQETPWLAVLRQMKKRPQLRLQRLQRLMRRLRSLSVKSRRRSQMKVMKRPERKRGQKREP